MQLIQFIRERAVSRVAEACFPYNRNPIRCHNANWARFWSISATLTEDQLWDVLEEQKQSPGEIIGQVAIRMGLATDAQVTEALAEQWGMTVVNLAETNIPPKVLELVPQTMAEIYKIMPISVKDGVLTVAMADPQNVGALDDLRNFLGYDVRGTVSNPQDVENAIQTNYADKQDSIEDVISGLEEELDEDEGGKGYSLDEEMESANTGADSQAAQHGAAARHQRPGLGHSLRAV